MFLTLFELVECVGGIYNRTCTGICGHCVNGEFCNQNNGYCVHGCRNHFLFPLCQGKTVIITKRDASLRYLSEIKDFSCLN